MITRPISRRSMIAAAVAALSWLGRPAPHQAADAATTGGEPTNILACRLANYGKYQDSAWTHLLAIGFRYVFLSVPPPDQVEATKTLLAQHGLQIAVVRGQTDLSQPACVDELAVQLETCAKLGVRYMFLSPKHPTVSKEVACERLRQAGDVARKHGVTTALETHPDLGTNGDVHAETMRRIDHPNVRVNFDTGNITFYNRDTTAAAELAKCIDYVATVEFKDHNGEFESWTFPTIGQGVVDFAAVMKLLREHGYRGPITMEVEGTRGVEMTEEETKQYIADSARYLRALGSFE